MKKGDWINIYRIDSFKGDPVQWDGIDEPKYGYIFEKWYPEVGQWCWKDTEFVLITAFKDLGREDGLITYSCSIPCRGESFTSSFKPEPFIGQLPLGAKGKR